MTAQTKLIEDLGGYRVVAATLLRFRDPCADDEAARKWADRVRKWRDNNHVPHWARPLVRQLAVAKGIAVPKELEEPQIDAA